MDSALSKSIERNYIINHANEVGRKLQTLSLSESTKIIQSKTVDEIKTILPYVPAWIVSQWFSKLSLSKVTTLLEGVETARSAEIISAMEPENSSELLKKLPRHLSRAIETALTYSSTQAGALMDQRIFPLNENITVHQAIKILKQHTLMTLRVVFLIDTEGKLLKFINVQDLLFASREQMLGDIGKDISAYIYDTDNEDEVFKKFSQYRLTDLPVTNYANKLIGVIRYKALFNAARDSAMTDIQTMVGVSKDERALSSFSLVVRKRLPWLQINLMTAFLAASVVGLFENVISSVTALAVLLPVVAGQSGNTGAQALAVTMRGIVLREVFTSEWNRLLIKEFLAAFINGIIIAATTGLFVYIWSQSIGLVSIIFISMIISMIIAAIAGMSIPLILIKFGMDPAQSSSIILTTITDVAGFFSFLGIASLLIHTIT